MEGITTATADQNSVRAILEGGPAGIPEPSRVQMVSPLNEKIKIPHCGGYEHFERIGEPGDGDLAREVVFRWAMRTKVAE